MTSPEGHRDAGGPQLGINDITENGDEITRKLYCIVVPLGSQWADRLASIEEGQQAIRKYDGFIGSVNETT